MATHKKKKMRGPGLVITIIMLLLAVEFIGLLSVTKLLPMYLLVAGSLALLTVVLIICLLTGNFRRKAPFTMGSVLAILLLVVIVVGNLYVIQTFNTLTRISGVNTKTSQIGVYVLTDDPAQTVTDAKDYVFGTLSNLDQENTEEAVRQIGDEVGGSIEVKAYDGVVELVDGLQEGGCGAIILNHAYIPVLGEMEGYEDIDSRLREIDLRSVDITINEKKQEDIFSSSAGTSEKQQDPDNIMRVYISGIDTRGSAIINTRSDVNIIATVNLDTKQVLLVSTPRDYYVPLSISGDIPDKLTHAGIYGVDVSMDTLGMLYDIEIDNYFRVNFAGFIKIIDALGGVNVHSDNTFSADGYYYTEGDNYLYGEAALAFARERKSLSGGDRQRGENQMAVITAVLNKAMSPELLSSYTSVLSAVEGSFETNISYDKIAELVRDQLADGGSWNIVSYSVNGTGDSKKPYSMSAYAYVMVPDMTTVEKAKELMQQVVDGEVIHLDDSVSDDNE